MKPLLIAAVVALLPAAAHADWEANMSARPLGQSAGGLLLSGKYRAKKEKARVDLQTPMGPRVTITDHKAKKSWILDASNSTYLEFDLEKMAGAAGQQMPACTGEIDACLASQGFKKTGAGEANGHKCTTWERTSGAGEKKSTEKLWRPNALKEVVMVRMLSTRADGSGMEFNLTDVKVAEQDASLFVLPDGYTLQSAPMFPGGPAPSEKGPAGGAAPSREQLEQLMKQYKGMQKQGK